MADCSLHHGGKVGFELTVHEMGKCIANIYAARNLSRAMMMT